MTTYTKPTKICRYCKQLKSMWGRQEVCDDPVCQSLLKAEQRESNKVSLQKVRAKRETSSLRLELKNSADKTDAKCIRCGKPCWPNYFYCKLCHTYVSNQTNTTETFPDTIEWADRENKQGG